MYFEGFHREYFDIQNSNCLLNLSNKNLISVDL